MAISGSLLPQIPTTRRMRDAEQTLALTTLTGEVEQLADLYKPDAIPAEWLPIMFQSLGCAPLYSHLADTAHMRRVYGNLYLADNGGEKDGIFWQRHGERALRLFSEALGLSFGYTIRRATNGKAEGITLTITPLGANTDFYRTSAAAQSYLRRAYEWILGGFLTIDAILFQTRHEARVGVIGDFRYWVEAEI